MPPNLDPGKVLQEIDNEEMVIGVDGKRTSMRKAEINFRQLFAKAIKGDLTAARIIATMAAQYFGPEAEGPCEARFIVVPNRKSKFEFGFVMPVVADDKGQVVIGHGRVLAAKKLGMPRIPVVEIKHLSLAQLKALRLADNRLAQNAHWDERLLGESFLELKELDIDFDLSFCQRALNLFSTLYLLSSAIGRLSEAMPILGWLECGGLCPLCNLVHSAASVVANRTVQGIPKKRILDGGFRKVTSRAWTPSLEIQAC